MEQQLDSVFDSSWAISEADGDLDFLLQMVGITQAACPVLLQNVREAVSVGNLGGIARRAHLMKAAAHSISARRTYESALLLETMALDGAVEGIQEACRKLQEEVERLELALTAFANSAWYPQ